MARQQIKIKGQSTTSGYEGGSTDSLVNLRDKNGAMTPVIPKDVYATLSRTYSYIFAHRTSNYDNWIGVSGTSLYIVKSDNEYPGVQILGIVVGTDPQFSQIGNVVYISSSSGAYYVIWKDGNYVSIPGFSDGAEDSSVLNPKGIIELTASGGYDENIDEITVRGYTYSSPGVSTTPDDPENLSLAESLMLKAKAKVAEEGYLNGFHLAVTAIELYDGSFVCHSNPVLLTQAYDRFSRYTVGGYNYLTNPYGLGSSFVSYSLPDGEYSHVFDKSTLTYHNPLRRNVSSAGASGECVGFADRQSLYWKKTEHLANSFEGIISSISVFLSREVTMYDFSKPFDAKLVAKPFLWRTKPDSEIIEELYNIGEFYRVLDIPFSSLKSDGVALGSWNEAILKGKLGDNLYVQENLPVDGFTHHTVTASAQYSYNSRLHLLNTTTKLSYGWPAKKYMNDVFYDKFQKHVYSMADVPGFGGVPGAWVSLVTSSVKYTMKYHVKTDMGVSTLIRTYLISGTTDYPVQLDQVISYPDPRAYRVDVMAEVLATGTKEVGIPAYNFKIVFFSTYELRSNGIHTYSSMISPDMKPVYYSSIEERALPISSETSSNSTVIEDSKLKVSAVNNPFYFPPQNTYVIGSSKALCMASNAMTVSEGQFGQYPLYVFTENGIYALEIGDTVLYRTQSPISFEQPISNKILSTPYGVIFITKDGLKIINGNQIQFISQELEQKRDTLYLDRMIDFVNISGTEYPYHGAYSALNKSKYFKGDVVRVSGIVYYKCLVNNPTTDPGSIEWQNLGVSGTVNQPFHTNTLELSDVLEDPALFMAFDHKEKEAIFKGSGNGFVFNFDSKSWYKQTQSFTSIIQNAYPNLYAVSGVNVIDYDNEIDPPAGAASVDCSFILRPVRFGTEDYKSLRRSWIRGQITGAEYIYAMLHGSDDHRNFNALRGIKLNSLVALKNDFKDIDLGVTGLKYKSYVISAAFKCTRDTKIELIEVEIDKFYDNEKL